MSEKMVKGDFRNLKISVVDPPEGHIRLEVEDEELAQLADSIRVQGLLSPIEVVARGDRFEVVFGHRRYLAVKRLGLGRIACRVVDRSDREIKVVRAVENIQRKNLTPIEEAASMQDLMEEGGMSVAEVADSVGVGAGLVQRRLGLLEMPAKFQKAVHEGKISVGVAEVLVRCPGEAKRDYFFDMAVEHGITVKVAREWVRDYESTLRRLGSGVEVGPGGVALGDPVVSYATCGVCRGPVDLEKVIHLPCCPECGEKIKDAIRGKGV